MIQYKYMYTHGYYLPLCIIYHSTLFFVLYYITTVTFEEIQKFPQH